MSTSHSTRPRVFVTGASGRIFQGIRATLESDYEFVPTDVFIDKDSPPNTQRIDLTDYEQVRRAMDRIDIVLHLAIASARHMRHMTKAEYDDTEMKVNVMGTQHLFEAAWLAGAKRIVYMSSMTVLMGQPQVEYYPRDMAPRPRGLYGCTKLFGEYLGRHYATQHGMTVICLRLGQPSPIPGWEYDSPRERRWRLNGTMCDMADVAVGVGCALAAKGVSFHIANLVSACERPTVDMSAGEEIGYRPTRRFTSNGMEVIREVSHV